MPESSDDRDPLDRLLEEFVASHRAGRRLPHRIRRPDPRTRRRGSRAIPRPGRARAAQAGHGRRDRRLRAATIPPRPPGSGRRLSHPPAGRSRRNGGRLRGSAGIARPPRRPQAAAGRRIGRSQEARALSSRGEGGGLAAPHQHRPGLRGWRGRRPTLLRHAVHRRPPARRGDRRDPPSQRQVHTPQARAVSEVALSLMTGRFAAAVAEVSSTIAGLPGESNGGARRRR